MRAVPEKVRHQQKDVRFWWKVRLDALLPRRKLMDLSRRNCG